MGKVADHGAFHPEVDLDRRTAQLRMSGGAGLGVGEAAKPGDIAGQFDDLLVVNVVQHRSGVPDFLPASALGGHVPWSYIWTGAAEIQSGRLTPWHPFWSQFGRGMLELQEQGTQAP